MSPERLLASLSTLVGGGGRAGFDARVLAVAVAVVDAPDTVSGLRERFDVSAAVASDWVARAVAAHVVTVEVDPADHRRRLVRLTPRGRRRLDRYVAARTAITTRG